MKNISGYKLLLLFFLTTLFCFTEVYGQSAKKNIKKLSSPSFHGRGYYKNGDIKAANFIQKEFKKAGLLPVNGSYYQPFTFPVNTFPGNMKVIVGNKKLTAGKDYIVSPSCPGVKGEFSLIKVTLPLQQFNFLNYVNDFLLLDKSGLDSAGAATLDSIARNPPDVRGIIIVESQKLTWSVSVKVNDKIVIRILKSSLPENADRIVLDIENKFINSYATKNVLGFIRGTQFPDSFIVFTAHYDHLGRMGKKALFAGANDNASGTAMIIDMAQYYSTASNAPKYSILFIAFAAEEAGLIGSKYYTEDPPFPLQQIRFLINLDLMGNGEEGVMVVNGEVHEKEFAILENINRDYKLVKEVGKRGKAKNSDHYWFSEKGVPAFFLYTQGGSKAYHDVYDLPSAIKLPEFEDIKILLIKFVNEITNQ